MATREGTNGRTAAWMAVLVLVDQATTGLCSPRAPLTRGLFARALTGAGKREMIVRHTTAHLHACLLLVQVLGRRPNKSTSHGSSEHR